jgi:hypothetical protein
VKVMPLRPYSVPKPSTTHHSETSTLLRLQTEEGWVGKKRLTMDNALWLKPRWADTRPSSVPACEREAYLARRPKRLSACPSSIECSMLAVQTLSAV